MGYRKVMPDGTVCRTGPNCKRHNASGIAGFINTLKTQINLAQDDPIPAIPASGLSDATFSKNKIIKGINGDTEKNDVLKQLDEESKDFAETMPQELQDTIRHYVSSYEFVNNYLRKGEEGILDYFDTFSTNMFPDKQASLNQYMDMAKQRVAAMDEAFATYERPEKNVRRLYRSERVPENITTEQYLSKYVPGEIVENKAYTSASADSDYMLVFNNPVKNKRRIVVFEMLSNEGIPVHKHDSFSGSIEHLEREVLLNRGAKFKVHGVTSKKFISTHAPGTIKGFQANEHIKSAEYIVVQLQQVN